MSIFTFIFAYLLHGNFFRGLSWRSLESSAREAETNISIYMCMHVCWICMYVCVGGGGGDVGSGIELSEISADSS